MYVGNTVETLESVSAGLPREVQPRHPLLVPPVSARRAQAMLKPVPLRDRLDLSTQPVWFRNQSELYVPYWMEAEYRKKVERDPRQMLKHPPMIYQPYWMKARGKVIQTRTAIHPKSHVLIHLGTDDVDGLGKGFHPFKAVTRAVHFTPKSFRLKNIMGAIGSITATTLTGGLGPIIAPKVVSANSKTMQKLGMATTAIAAVAGAVILGPAIATALGPKLAAAGDLLGKGADYFGTAGSAFTSFFNKQSPSDQQAIADTASAQDIADIENGKMNPAQLLARGGGGDQKVRLAEIEARTKAGEITHKETLARIAERKHAEKLRSQEAEWQAQTSQAAIQTAKDVALEAHAQAAAAREQAAQQQREMASLFAQQAAEQQKTLYIVGGGVVVLTIGLVIALKK